MEVHKNRSGYLYKGTTLRGYDVIDGELKWGYVGRERFEFVKGNKYMVRHENPAKALHKGAVGILSGIRCNEKHRSYSAVLKCCRKRFQINPAALVPYDGEITEKHLELITPLKKVHLSEDGRCICKCDKTPHTNPTKLVYDDFMTVPENTRCTNCNRIISKRNRGVMCGD